MENLLLHACCAPCSSYMFNELSKEYKVQIFYYNPNIYPEEEYYKRKNEIKEYCKKQNINFIEEAYNYQEFLEIAKGLEGEPERGKRCDLCYNLRMEKTAQKAKELGIKYFATTLMMGRQKKTDKIIEIGNKLAEKYSLIFIDQDFKKQGGGPENDRLSKKHDFYRQTYCGCEYSIKKQKLEI